jgi:hypothetical protein
MATEHSLLMPINGGFNGKAQLEMFDVQLTCLIIKGWYCEVLILFNIGGIFKHRKSNYHHDSWDNIHQNHTASKLLAITNHHITTSTKTRPKSPRTILLIHIDPLQSDAIYI